VKEVAARGAPARRGAWIGVATVAFLGVAWYVLTTVTGTISSGSFSFVLDNSIVWNPFGSASFPQAGLWHCINSPINEKPGCIHQ